MGWFSKKPKKGKCTHCGKPLRLIAHGAGARWMHADEKNPDWLDLMYLGCRFPGPVAEPKQKKGWFW